MQPERDWRLRIQDILDAIRAIQTYTDGVTFEAFSVDRKTFDAVVRNLTIIGEAVRHVPDSLQIKHPDIP